MNRIHAHFRHTFNRWRTRHWHARDVYFNSLTKRNNLFGFSLWLWHSEVARQSVTAVRKRKKSATNGQELIEFLIALNTNGEQSSVDSGTQKHRAHFIF